MGAFQNGLKARHFNESLTQRPTSLLEEVATRAKCYIKGKERNTEKRARGVKELTPSIEGSQQSRKNKYTSPIKDIVALKRV